MLKIKAGDLIRVHSDWSGCKNYNVDPHQFYKVLYAIYDHRCSLLVAFGPGMLHTCVTPPNNAVSIVDDYKKKHPDVTFGYIHDVDVDVVQIKAYRSKEVE